MKSSFNVLRLALVTDESRPSVRSGDLRGFNLIAFYCTNPQLSLSSSSSSSASSSSFEVAMIPDQAIYEESSRWSREGAIREPGTEWLEGTMELPHHPLWTRDLFILISSPAASSSPSNSFNSAKCVVYKVMFPPLFSINFNFNHIRRDWSILTHK